MRSVPWLAATILVVALILPGAAFASPDQAPQTPLRFLGNAEIPPMIFVQNGQPTGVVVDLARAVAEKAGLAIRIEAMDWPAAQALVAAGQADALLQINPTPERDRLYDFSGTLLQSDFCLLRKTSRAEIQGLVSLVGKKVGVEQAGFSIQYLGQYKQIEQVLLPSWEAGFRMLQAEQIDAILVDRWVGEYELYLNKVRGVTVVEPPLVTDYSRIAVKKGNQALLDRINLGLGEIDRDGTRQRILDKWRAKEVVYLSREFVQGVLFCLVLLAVALVALVALRPLGWSSQLSGRGPWPGARASWFGYGLAVVTTGLAAFARWLVPWALAPAPYLGFYPAVVVSAALGGVGPGLASTFASLALVNLVFGHFNLSDHGAVARQVIWVAASVGVSVLAGMQRAARIRERQQAGELRAAVAKQEAISNELEAANIEAEQANSDLQEANLQLEESNAQFAQENEERQRAEAALRQLNEQLEHRVAERTAEVAEQARKVQAERQRFLEMLDTLPVIIDIIRADHRIEWANRAYREALGDNVGRLCYASQFERDTPCAECQAFVPLRTGRPHRWEWTLPNGRTFDIHNFPFAAADGSPAILEMDIDITEQKQAAAILQDLNATLEQRVTERTADLRASEEQFRVLTANLHSGVALIDDRGAFRIVNGAFLRMFDLPPDADILNINSRDWAQWQVFDEHGALLDVDDHPVRKAVRTRAAVQNELIAMKSPSRPDVKWLLVSAEPIVDTQGGIHRLICTYYDITARKQAEETLKAALADNQALLREVHHRVKNNLQMLCDLMYLQMEAMPDRDQHRDLQDAYGRIYAIARLHEQLYQTMESGRIRLDEYLRRLVGGFESLFSAASINVESAADGVSLDLDRAIHVGLIVNELITNALKHAFPKEQRGEITVALATVGDQVQLRVRDNGRGLPADLDLERAKSVGLRTVYILTKRLAATVDVGNKNGTCFTITFPLHAEEPVEPRAE